VTAGEPARVLLINQYFWPDVAATAQLLAELAEDLGAGGATITALAGRGSYVPGPRGKLPRREKWRGVEVRRVRCTSFGRGSTLGRVTDYLTFLAGAKLAVLFGRRRDVVICLSTPPLVGVLGWLARLRGARLVYKVEDLYPDVAMMLGTLQAGSLVARGSAALSGLLLRCADAVVALDEGMAKALRERGARRVNVIPNWADGRAIRPDEEAGATFRREHGLERRFVVLYSGNLGLAHRFDAVLAAARTLAEQEPRVLFLFVGGGPRLADAQAEARGLANVRFLPYQPRENLRGLFNAADVHLVTLRDEVSGMVVPSKYPSALAAGKPVLLVGGRGTEMREEIGREGVGWYCDHKSDAVRDTLLDACRHPEVLDGVSAKARSLLERKYERRLCTRQWAELLSRVLQSGRVPEPKHA
jgi:glycosyltransferase involved in cell wall biosynthesis